MSGSQYNVQTFHKIILKQKIKEKKQHTRTFRHIHNISVDYTFFELLSDMRHMMLASYELNNLNFSIILKAVLPAGLFPTYWTKIRSLNRARYLFFVIFTQF